MRDFAALLERLAFTPQRLGKTAHLVRFFRDVPDPARGLALAALTGDLRLRTVTASLLGLIMAAVSGALLTYGLAILLPESQLSIPWSILGVSTLISLVIVVLATTVPVLRSLRQPAPRIINRFVAA